MPPANNPTLPPRQSLLLACSAEASVLIGDIFDEVSKRFTADAFPNRTEGLTLWQLQASCHASSESTLILIGNIRLWDADVLVRSVVEGSLKFAYLLLGDATEREKKLREYEHMLFEIAELKRNGRLLEILAVLKDSQDDEWRPFRDMLLSDQRIAEIRANYPKDVRRTLEQRWSFGEIFAALKRSSTPIAQLGHLMYNYGMSSHVAHQDATGIGMVWDRNGRNDERREAVELAHGARLLSDVCIMSWVRAYMLFKRVGVDSASLKPFMDRVNLLDQKTRPFIEKFHSVEYGG